MSKQNWQANKVDVKPCNSCVLYIKWDKNTATSIQYTDSSGQIRSGSNRPLALHAPKFHEHNNLEEAKSSEQQLQQQYKAIDGYYNLINGNVPTGQNQITNPLPVTNPTPQNLGKSQEQQHENNSVILNHIQNIYEKMAEIKSDIDLVLLKQNGAKDFAEAMENVMIRVVEIINDQRIESERKVEEIKQMLGPKFKTAEEMVNE
jgi:hypothetical protein